MRTYPEASWTIGEGANQGLTYQEVARYAANLIRKDGPDQHFIVWWAVFDCAFYSYGKATYDPDMNAEGHSAYIAAAMRNATNDWYRAHPEVPRPQPS